MQPADAFTLIAELAIGVLGFGGIVVALGRHELRQFGPRLMHMVYTASVALVFSILPLPLILGDTSIVSSAVSICSVMLLVALLLNFLHLIDQWGRMSGVNVNPILLAPFVILNVAAFIPVLLAALGHESGWSYYLWGLVYMIFTATYLLARMIWITRTGKHKLESSE